MPKHDRWSPKGISNRMKSKGLQKLRWYCQMCQKQCRDQNGFKCHTMSESHQRQLLLFAENPRRFLDGYSHEFEKHYLDILRRRYGTKRVHANVVYQEYISWKEHLHMNATIWETLGSFIAHLGRVGKCKVERTEKGWYIEYIDREALEREAQLEKKRKADKEDDERMMEFIQKQAEREKARELRELGGAPPSSSSEYQPGTSSELLRLDTDEKIKIELPKSSNSAKPSFCPNSSVLATIKSSAVDSNVRLKSMKSSAGSNKPLTKNEETLDQLRREEEGLKELKNRKDFWLHPSTIVKIISKRFGEQFYKKKAVVQSVIDDYVGHLKLLEKDEEVDVDQRYLETVIPARGKRVLIVNGAYRGCVAVLLSLNEDTFSGNLKIDSGPLKDRVLSCVKYEDFCKLFEAKSTTLIDLSDT